MFRIGSPAQPYVAASAGVVKSEKRKVVVKGRAPVDIECAQKVGTAHVYCEGNDVYDVMLNQVGRCDSAVVKAFN